MQVHAAMFNPKSLTIVCDFDGTISLKDTTDLLLQTFASKDWLEIEQQWQHGLIGSKQCMQQQIALLDMSLHDLYSTLDQIQLDTSLIELVNFCQSHHIPIIIVSDGLDIVIKYLLNKINLGHLTIIANQLIQTSERHWKLAFPNQNTHCKNESGTCKCKVATTLLHNVILIGDGRSDFCIAHQAEYVFAKNGLQSYCHQQNIPFQAINMLSDSLVCLKKMVSIPKVKV